MLKMNIFNDLWRDERGAVVTSELVLLGTIGVVGASVGAQKVSKALNAEMTDLAHSIRSLDQSYVIPERRSCCGAWTAGSSFKQLPVEQALRDLGVDEAPVEAPKPRKNKKNNKKKQAEAQQQESQTAPLVIPAPVETEPEV